MKYPIAIHKDEDSCYGVTVPDIPGCFSAGDTIDKAVINAKNDSVIHVQFVVQDLHVLCAHINLCVAAACC